MPEAALTGAGTVLAFDFGTKRIGIAVGEGLLRLAHPLAEIAAEDNDARFAAIAALIAQWQPQLLVVGVPQSAQGGPHGFERRAGRFARQLQGRFGLPVSLVDERYTSAEAASALRDAGARKPPRGRAKNAHRGIGLDAASAQLILQQWFDERRG